MLFFTELFIQGGALRAGLRQRLIKDVCVEKQLCGRFIKLYRALENILILCGVWRGRVVAAQASHGQVSAQHPATGGKNISQDVLYSKGRSLPNSGLAWTW